MLNWHHQSQDECTETSNAPVWIKLPSFPCYPSLVMHMPPPPPTPFELNVIICFSGTEGNLPRRSGCLFGTEDYHHASVLRKYFHLHLHRVIAPSAPGLADGLSPSLRAGVSHPKHPTSVCICSLAHFAHSLPCSQTNILTPTPKKQPEASFLHPYGLQQKVSWCYSETLQLSISCFTQAANAQHLNVSQIVLTQPTETTWLFVSKWLLYDILMSFF